MQLQSTIIDDLTGNLENSKINSRLYHDADIYQSMNTFTTLEELFESIEGPCIYDFFTDDELALIKKIIFDRKDKAFKKKFQKLDAIVKPKGFKRSGCGTNRVVYEPLDDNATFCIKIALDRAGSKNNPDEIVNQKYLKPFVAKCFDISQDGNVGIFERVVPIENLYQMWSVRDDIYKIMETIVGRFIIDDFGTKAFKNWGLRKGFGPVLLDYADMYILDPKILYCTHTLNLDTTEQCRGELDYDAGFNNIICLKCGGIHMASEFKNGRKKIALFSRKREIDMSMKIEIFKDGELYWDNDHGIYGKDIKTNESVENELDISSKLDLEEIDKLKDDLAELEAKSIASENKLRQQYEDMRKVADDHKREKAEEFLKEEKPDLVIEIPAINPAPKRFNKYFAPKPERPARDLENTMHNKALDKLSEDMKKPQNTIISNPIVVKTKETGNVKNDNDVDIKVEEKQPVEEKEDMLLTIDQIKTLGNYIGEAAADIESVVGTEDAYSYNEILELDKQFTRILKDLSDDKVIRIEDLLPEVFYAYIDSDIKKDNEVRVGDFRKALADELASAATIILNIKLDIESEFEEEDEEPKVRRRRMSNDRY
jgi:hypothetical protein|nr:MAG TPA: hypothetical protein [Caudoviricetes sp.]